MATVRINYFGMEGQGANVTEAKKDAGRKIEAALSGTYTPEVLSWRGYTALVWREPSGWESRLIADPEAGIRPGKVWGSAGCGHDFAAAMVSAQLNLAQLGWVASDGEQQPEFLKNATAIREFRSWVRFQIRYQDGRRRGMSDHDAHSYAGRNPARPELWAHEETGIDLGALAAACE